MRKFTKNIALVLACVMLMGLLGGCGSFDASAYLNALLDNFYKNDSTAMVKQDIATEEEASAIYEEGLDAQLDAIMSSANVSEDQAESMRDVIATMLSNVKYTVGEAEKQEDDSYVVTVTYEQMQVFRPTIDKYMAAVDTMVNEWKEAATAGEETPSEDEMMEKIIAAFVTALEDVIYNATYAEPQTTTVRIELTDGAYAPKIEDLQNLEYVLFDNDAIQ